MINCVFTVDYEIYGNGRGSLEELVYKPAKELRSLFGKWNAPCVFFVEAAELEIIGSEGADPTIDLVERQIREFHGEGIEIGLHLHPQWYNAHFNDSQWQLDFREYNLCSLSPDRINHIINRSLAYLREVLGDPGFTPSSFRAGNWLLQPTREVAKSLSEHGIKVDSSVYKGGVQHLHNLDYRRSLQNGYYWRFSEDVNVPDPLGVLLEIPTYTRMVPIWNILTTKRIRLQQQGAAGKNPKHQKGSQLRDCLRPVFPMKLDFCRLTSAEMIRIFDQEIQKDLRESSFFRPIVAIGHTKDLVDLETVESFLSYLRRKGIPVSTLRDVHDKIIRQSERS